MVGILLITHNGLGDSLVDCVRHVIGSVPPHLKTLSVLANDDPAQKENEARALIAQLDSGNGVLLLSDVYGATPCNIARRLCIPDRVEGVAGVNLPMLLRVACYCNLPLEELVQRAVEGGRDCIVKIHMDGTDAKAGCADH
ncbi:MAG: PTS sugar transporter subunit IIA [Gammaproteobacteria bacterium]|nr:PTS sugar transporter subunit IIA [Gammaproteobacteria bacterium]MBU1776398.1 PTS sugar transporter subunit IIA [Gammaproteobacteria bacterium]MBU1968089.1 PTS sugar transporter subunit IIA [Gammaproteobacteria bacterium]